MLGAGKLMLRRAGGSSGPSGPVGTYEAESAAVVGALVMNQNPGFTGAGYVGSWGGTGQTVTFTVQVPSAATYRMTFRFRNAHGTTATRNLTVDSTELAPLSFTNNAPTWETDRWDTVSAITTLTAGTHTIRLTHPGPDLQNYLDLDNVALEVTTTAPPPPPPPPPTGGAVDFAVLFQQFYPPGPGRQWVALTGSNSNPGTQSSPKRDISSAIAALGSGGGIVWCGDGDYGGQNFQDMNYSANGWTLIMSQNLHGAACTNTGGNVVTFTRCSYVGFYGFRVFSNENPSITTQLGISTGYDPGGTSHHLAWWKNHVAHMSQGGLGAAGNNHRYDYIDIAYNWVHNTARFFYSAGSNISLYQARNLTPSDAGYHCNIVGNICYYAYNEPGTAETDGNGIIIDDWMWTQGDSSQRNYAKCLVMGNLTVNNGGRGHHSPWVDTCHQVFNTSAANMWAIGDHSRGGENALGGQGSRGNCNVTYLDPAHKADGQTWSQYFVNEWGGSILDNTVLSGSYHGPNDFQLRNRTSTGLNYFRSNTPNRTPYNDAQIDQWRPDGGGGTIERTVIAQADYDVWKRWPDYFGYYRPTDRNWAHGFAEPG